MRLKNKHCFQGFKWCPSSGSKPINFLVSSYSALDTTHYPPWNTPFLVPVTLPFPGFPPCPQVLTFHRIPPWTFISLQVSFTGLMATSVPMIPNPDFSPVPSPEHQTPAASCLLHAPTCMSHWFPTVSFCQALFLLSCPYPQRCPPRKLEVTLELSPLKPASIQLPFSC